MSDKRMSFKAPIPIRKDSSSKVKKWTRNKKPKSGDVLVTLTQEELNSVINSERILNDVSIQQALVLRGYQSLWYAIKQKYNIPGEVDFDKETGTIKLL